jgi:hypothetical protein
VECAALAILSLGPALPWYPSPLAAQGVTGAAIDGRVVSLDSTPLDQAIVQVTNSSTGERWRTTTSARGRYFIEYLSVGGPYRIEVRAVGYTPARRDSLRLRLGQRLAADFTLTPAAVQLQEISVTGALDPRLSADRTGPAQIISDSTIARLPVPGRDFTELAVLAPQVTKSPSINGGLSFAGQHDRYNSIRVDGIGNNDPFGRIQSGNGLAGWGPGVRALTPEAIEELQIVSAPFDVRYGDFAGGLINAVTKSGSNQIEGSIVSYFESDELNQKDITGSRGPDFSRKELGLTLGAPIVQDHLALFVNAATTREVFPQEVPATSNDSLYESLLRFQDLLRGYGVDPGDISDGPFRARSLNLLVKVTAQLGVNSRLEVSHDHRDGETRDETPLLSSSFVPGWETIDATRLAWTTAFGDRFSNELTLARVDDSRACVPIFDLPRVSVPTEHGDLYAGVEGFFSPCGDREAGHSTWEFTDNFGLAAGSHRLTFGIHGERIDLVENPGLATRGVWSFENLDSLESGAPSAYFRNSPTVADTQMVFRVDQIGFYLQDQWLPTPRLTLTAGLRLDVPFVPEEPPRNKAAWDEMGINTALTPSGNPLWSPRLGVNYDLSGRGTTRVRGGAGLFAGHPPLVWFRNVYGFNAAWNTTLDCSGSDVPAFTLDSNNQPTACGDGSPPTWNPVFFDPDFHFPQTLKLALGADHLLPWGIVGTLDFLYTRSVYAAHTVDVNHRLVGTAAGEGGRAMYGAIDPETGEVEKSRRFPALAEVYQMRNGSGDRSYSITAQLGKRFPNGTEVSLAYTYEDAKDRMSMEWNFPSDQESSTPVNGTLEDRELSESYWERPHKITLVATTDLPLGVRFGFTYIGMSATAYTHLVDGDANADGYGNDAVYVPRDVRPGGDVTLVVNDGTDHFVPAPASVYAELDRQIQADPCLRHQRGRLLVRNSCRDPWGHETTARLSKRFRLADRRALEVTADLFNLLSFLGSDWGVGPYPNHFGGLRLAGYDTANGRGVYEAGKVEQFERDPGASRWHMQLGATLTF